MLSHFRPGVQEVVSLAEGTHAMTAVVTPTAHSPPHPVDVALADESVRARLLAQATVALRGRHADAEDVVHTVIERALKKRHEYDPTAGASVTAWLAGFVPFVCKEKLREGVRAPAQQHEENAAWNEVAVARPDPAFDLADMRFRAERHLKELSADERAVVVPRFFEDMDLKEIAAKLSISHTAARQRFSRAMNKLKQIAVTKGDRS